MEELNLTVTGRPLNQITGLTEERTVERYLRRQRRVSYTNGMTLSVLKNSSLFARTPLRLII
jgi:hypothetical protein